MMKNTFFKNRQKSLFPVFNHTFFTRNKKPEDPKKGYYIKDEAILLEKFRELKEKKNYLEI